MPRLQRNRKTTNASTKYTRRKMRCVQRKENNQHVNRIAANDDMSSRTP